MAPDDGSQAMARIPRGSRVYTPRVGPHPVPKVPPLNDALVIEFDQVNPKRAPSASYGLYELLQDGHDCGRGGEIGRDDRPCALRREEGLRSSSR